MADILIRGMEMPSKKNGAVLVIYPDGKACYENGEEYKAIPVPPHGDLIDKDEAFSTFEPSVDNLTEFQRGWNASMKYIDSFPTIIPADKEVNT